MPMSENSPAVIMKAFLIATEEMGLVSSEAASIMGITEQNLRDSTFVGFNQGTPYQEIQLAIIRLYHLLIAMADGDSHFISEWLNRYNPHLDAVPINVCHNLAGVLYVNDYLESIQEDKLIQGAKGTGKLALYPRKEEEGGYR